MQRRRKLLSIYRKLDSELKERSWKQEWPGESPYEVAVGAVLTQNTSWKNVEKAIANMKEAGILSERGVLRAPLSKLEALIRPAGFYRQKAKRLKAMTRAWLNIKKMNDKGEMRSMLLKTHGIGKETADSILLYALGKRIFVVDAYTRAFCREILGKEWKGYDKCQEFFESALPKSASWYKRYHALIVEWGKRQSAKKRRLKL